MAITLVILSNICIFPVLPCVHLIAILSEYRFLPDDLKKKQVKTVLVVRNPKDTAVSYYSQFRGISVYEYEGKWENWLRPYIEGRCKCNKVNIHVDNMYL